MNLHCFQDGIKNFNTWVAESFGIDNNTSATILITLIVFISGGLIRAFFQSLQASAIRGVRRRIVFLNINDLVSSVRKQAHSYHKFRDQMERMTGDPFILELSGMCEARVLTEMGYEVTFSAFFPSPFLGVSFTSQKKLKAFHKLWQVLETVTYWQQLATEDYKQFLQTYNELDDQRREALRGYQQLMDPILLMGGSPDYDEENADLLQAVRQIHHAWRITSNNNLPRAVQENLIFPLQELVKAHKNHTMLEMLKFLHPASLNYQHMADLLKVKQQQFFFYHILFKSCARQLEKISLILN